MAQLRQLLERDDPAATEFLQHNATMLQAVLGESFAVVQAQVRNFDFELALAQMPERREGDPQDRPIGGQDL